MGKEKLLHEPYLKLRGKLAENQITYEALAAHLDTHLSTVSLKMSGRSDFTIAESVLICKLLKCKLDDIFLVE